MYYREYGRTTESAKNLKYRLFEKDTNNLLAEGRTDDQGATKRVVTEGPKHLEIFIFRATDDQKGEWKKVNDAYLTTSEYKDSKEMAYIPKGHVFFDIRYINAIKDPAQSFKKAAETVKRKTRGGGSFDKYRSDVWWSFDVTSECDIKARWEELAKLLQEFNMEVQEGHIFTHANKQDPKNAGLEFAEVVGCDQDATLKLREIEKMPKLKWSNRSILYLYGCRSGIPIDPPGINPFSEYNSLRIADYFFENQDMSRIVALQGFGYFSYSPTVYQRIADDVNDTRDIYLAAFRRMRNVSDSNAWCVKHIRDDCERGDLTLIEPYTRTR
ncbi:MAG: hypothetical protein LBP58_06560 [Azoarcus sp.]|nr:hypothetical protein [Azoarcus sp.]